jgi:D-threo-aldose 1-dehydrogenase
MVDPRNSVAIGRTGVRVSRLGLGGAPFGGLFAEVARDTAAATVRTAFELGIRYVDTAPLYGHGKSEASIGEALRGVPRAWFTLSTKVGRSLVPVASPPHSDHFVGLPPVDTGYDFSRDGILRSLQGSLARLGLDRVDIVYVHDPDDHLDQVVRETFPALADLRAQGVVGAIGAGMNHAAPLVHLARECAFDCFLLAGRYTLLDQSGLPELLPLCLDRQISVVIGGPYNSGILASDLADGATYFYEPAPGGVLERARRIRAVCDRHRVPLKAAALQFGLGHPAVAATIPGARTPSEVRDNWELMSFPIPTDLWLELRHEGFLPEDAPIPS